MSGKARPVEHPSYKSIAFITNHQLHRLGRDYPDENYNFNMRLRRAFESEYTLQLDWK